MSRRLKITAALILIVMLITASIPVLAAGTSAKVIGADLNVYKDPYLTQFWGTVKTGTVVQLNKTIGGVSQISLNGKTGYCEADGLTSMSEQVETVICTTKTTQKTRVYRAASLKSAYSYVAAGTTVDVVAVSGVCAKVKKGKYVGYMYTGHLEAYTASTEPAQDEAYEEAIEQVDSTGITSLSTMIESGKYTNEQIVFAFAVKCMGYNAAAAAGLLANISAESGFKPAIVGDSGTSLGICQWHASRKTRLINYCTTKGYDYKSLEGQLWYLKYELETYYPSVNRYMLGVGDNADGAYDAGYYFCYNFEAPANRVSKSKTRATNAQNKYYSKYANYTI